SGRRKTRRRRRCALEESADPAAALSTNPGGDDLEREPHRGAGSDRSDEGPVRIARVAPGAVRWSGDGAVAGDGARPAGVLSSADAVPHFGAVNATRDRRCL